MHDTCGLAHAPQAVAGEAKRVGLPCSARDDELARDALRDARRDHRVTHLAGAKSVAVPGLEETGGTRRGAGEMRLRVPCT